MELKKGKLLQNGKYRIEGVLGQGGFGITYLAVQVGLNRKVAVKEFYMKEHCNRDADTSFVSVPSVGSRELVEGFKNKFVKEAQNIASFNHNNIIRIHDIFEENGTTYYVMEYHDCGSLSDYVTRKGRLSEEEAMFFIRQIADALAYIHELKINHLDIKPGNILLDKKNNAILIDFGLSKHYDEVGGQTTSSPVGYAPMEQYKQGGVSQFSPSTDIYSLGATMYKLVTGETPAEADEINEDGLSFPADVVLSDSVKKAIEFAMQPKRKDRPQSIEEFLRRFEVTACSKVQSDEATVIDVVDNNSVDEETVFETKEQDRREEEERKHKEEEERKRKNRRKWIIAGVLSLLVLCVVGLMSEGGSQQTSGNASQDVGETRNGHEYVDLGLPSGLKWATCNVGANKPEDYGDYFAWGETETKTEYSRENSLTREHSVSELRRRGIVDGNNRLTSSHDAATVNWGGSWRMPTKEELEELENKCTWTWTTQNGVKGYKVTGLNGNSIFLPAAGYRYGTSLIDAGCYGDYWSSTPNDDFDFGAYYLAFDYGYEYVDDFYRVYGFTVRPITE